MRLVDAGELGAVVAAVGRVAISGLGVAGSVSQGLDIGVRVVAVIGILGAASSLWGYLRQPLSPRRVLVRRSRGGVQLCRAIRVDLATAALSVVFVSESLVLVGSRSLDAQAITILRQSFDRSKNGGCGES
ncbi:hypothetical protein GCM10023107_92000 [Actinoplanes octamycinicus]